jgi:hypothetical protein
MHAKQAKLGRFGVAILAVLAVGAGLSGRAYTQYRASLKSTWMGRNALVVARAEMAREQTGAPDDWSHRHLVFSNPGPEENAIQNGRYDSWLHITNDPRFIMQQKKRAVGSKQLADRKVFAAASGNSGLISPVVNKGGRAGGKQAAPIHRDWAIGLGTGNPTQATYPAKWSFDTTTASCSGDFVAYPTGAAGAAGQASIIAYFNLYTGCGGTVPTVAWAFNTGGTVTGAPVFSFDGTQMAFIQLTGGAATLVLLKLPTSLPGTGSLTTPTTLATTQTNTTYPTCTAPCMLRITLNGNPTDTWSNPWVEYASDSLFVGDDSGKLHKFSPVFTGTAGTPTAEIVVATVWPVTLDATPIASPVFDSSTGKVFVGSGGGFFYAIGGGAPQFPLITSGHIYGTSTRLGPAAQTTEIEDAPLVDSSAGMAYVFLQRDTAGTPNNAVVQFATSFTTGSGTKATVGTFGRTSEPELSGTFDNIYFNSESACGSTGCTPSGNLYVAGNTSVNATLYQIPIAANVMGTVHTGPVIGDSGFFGRSSPVTEFVTDSTATATVTINTNPGGFTPWTNATRAVTLGTVKYTFVTGAPAASTATAVQVRINAGSVSTATNEARTASNLAAAINADVTLCTGTLPCFGAGTVANTSASATYPGAGGSNEVDLTATVAGSAGSFTLTNSGSTTTGIAVSAVTGGTTVDSIFLSTYSDNNNGSGNGCATGCVYSFDVTSGATITSATAPSATLAVTANIANADGYVTGGILIDNDVSSATLGTQQIYFLSLDNASGVTCSTSGSRICATQASQSGLN